MTFFGIASFLFLVIPLAILGAMAFSAFLAHRGAPTRGTLITLISAGVLAISLIGSVALSFFAISHISAIIGASSGSSSQPPESFLSFANLLPILISLASLGGLAFAIGLYLMGRHWPTLCRECEELEESARRLTAEREAGAPPTTAANTVDHSINPH
ncbi:hypothetical protein [Roseibacillus ishigakijimensis]|uniref:Uncharacterized protein n=1 Tax=Roseibacillus ishigakijimensis TaxID=454146 RepID=A0A934VNJ1_9BACT|nr:hypothetical protein [Roseibacillus ishigakijimensis]MBK1835156.1 hypothetical protein [Roseibacillus ishigakijimensis]